MNREWRGPRRMSSLGNYQVAWLSNPFLGHILVISLHSLSLSKITKSLGGKTKCCDDINKSKHPFFTAKYFFFEDAFYLNYFQMSCESHKSWPKIRNFQSWKFCWPWPEQRSLPVHTTRAKGSKQFDKLKEISAKSSENDRKWRKKIANDGKRQKMTENRGKW